MRQNKWLPYFYSTPALIVIGLVVLYPILYTGYISLTNMNIYHWFNFDFIGLENYRRALFTMDTGFLGAIVRTILWTVVNMVLQLFIAFSLAVMLNAKGLHLRRVYKTILMFAWAMPGYVSILLWKMGMLNTEFGVINQFLGIFGIGRINWLSNNTLAFISCVVVNLWLALPFMIMIIDGALQSVDKTYYESAMLEGAGFLQQTISITIPQIKSVIAPAVVMTIFTTFKQFDVIYLLTQQTGAKTGANIHTVITYAYEKAFVTNNYGLSSAVSIFIFVMLLLFTALTQIRSRKKANHD